MRGILAVCLFFVIGSLHAATISCDLELYRIYFEETPAGKIVRQTLLETKELKEKLPVRTDGTETFILEGTLGPYSVSASYFMAEKSFSSIFVTDDSHSVEVQNDFTVFTSLARKDRLVVSCN